MKLFHLFILAFLLFSCGNDDEVTPDEKEDTSTSYPNILLIIADDMGKDATNGFSEGSTKPTTPHLDALQNSGLTFSNFWSYPTCSPTRASMITGKYGYRTGVKWANDVMSTSEQVLQSYINENTNDRYATAIIGKWHLSGGQSSINPETLGIDYYAGIISGAVQDYYQWPLSSDSENSQQKEYVTQTLTDLSIDWIGEQSKPWFLWLAYNAPHTPFHAPPADMHSQGDLPDYTNGASPMPYYMAAIEAMDYQIGQLLESIPADERENTIVIFMGDNGTPNQVAQFPYSRNNVKGTVYQGGINVPFFVSGAGVTRTGEDENLICSTDIFSTIAELAGVNATSVHDSQSFKELLSNTGEHRNYQYSEMKSDEYDLWAIRNSQFKLIVNANGDKQFFDLVNDPNEKSNLLDGALSSVQTSNKEALESELAVIRN